MNHRSIELRVTALRHRVSGKVVESSASLPAEVEAGEPLRRRKTLRMLVLVLHLEDEEEVVQEGEAELDEAKAEEQEM